jgi:hypothetical protein
VQEEDGVDELGDVVWGGEVVDYVLYRGVVVGVENGAFGYFV